jgi:hypothetical protein
MKCLSPPRRRSAIVAGRRTIFQRIYLTLVVGGQIIIAPILAFSATYLVHIDTEAYTVSLRMELLPWIISAAIGYGLLSLMLALVIGGWIPRKIADAGGWAAALGFSHRLRDADLVDRTRMRLARGPFGRIGRIVHREVHGEGRELLEIHGGLQILAAPLQIGLVLSPILLMQFTPPEYIATGRLMEFGMFGYLIALTLGLRLFPMYADRMVVVASRLRRAISKVTRFSWMAPVLLLWLFVRLAISITFDQFGLDVENWQEFAIEKRLLEALLPVSIAVPESSFLDLLVALSILPVATFTTLVTVLGGGAEVPRWMLHGEDLLDDISAPKKKQISIDADSKSVRPMLFSEMAEVGSDSPDKMENVGDIESRSRDMEGTGPEHSQMGLSLQDGDGDGHGLDGTDKSELTRAGGEQSFGQQSAEEAGGNSLFSFPEGSFGEDSADVDSSPRVTGSDESGGEDGAFNMPGMSGWVAAKITDKIEPRMRRN